MVAWVFAADVLLWVSLYRRTSLLLGFYCTREPVMCWVLLYSWTSHLLGFIVQENQSSVRFYCTGEPVICWFLLYRRTSHLFGLLYRKTSHLFGLLYRRTSHLFGLLYRRTSHAESFDVVSYIILVYPYVESVCVYHSVTYIFNLYRCFRYIISRWNGIAVIMLNNWNKSKLIACCT